MTYSPKVSIVIPVFNGSDYMNQAIDSALAQTYPNIEIVVVNDGSNDGGATEKIVLSYGEKVRYFSKENGGVGSALNVAIKEMSGEYFSWLSHDDLYYPDKVESQVKTLAGMENLKTILYGDYAVFSDNPNKVSEKRLPSVPPEQFRYFLTVKNVLHGCTLLLPKSAFDEYGLFNEKLRTTQDYDLWFRMAKKYHFVHIPKLLVKARHHAEQGSVKMGSIALKECDELLTGFVEELSEAEIEAATHSSNSLSYAKISASMQYRGFYNAARCSSALAIKNFGKGSMSDDLKSALVLLRAKWFDVLIAKLRRLFVDMRFKVKNV
ncbi:MAG: glycosyl transferase [Nitrospira bacterium HGW-Nitrospira-1]|nr:MAG: glycosyl transferase [Nitrospira bacterium HGW-Nitrospira-1]